MNGLLYYEKSHLYMDDDWGYPYFRKPPFVKMCFQTQLQTGSTDSEESNQIPNALSNHRGAWAPESLFPQGSPQFDLAVQIAFFALA